MDNLTLISIATSRQWKYPKWSKLDITLAQAMCETFLPHVPVTFEDFNTVQTFNLGVVNLHKVYCTPQGQHLYTFDGKAFYCPINSYIVSTDDQVQPWSPSEVYTGFTLSKGNTLLMPSKERTYRNLSEAARAAIAVYHALDESQGIPF